MMLILADAARFPLLFHWFGPVPLDAVQAWVRTNEWILPPDLLAFWSATGGGDFFESETLLAPMADASADGVIAVNEFLRGQSFPRNWLAFHTGVTVSVLDLDAQQYRMLERHMEWGSLEQPIYGFTTIGVHGSFDDWYEAGLRPLFEDKYSLDAPRPWPRFAEQGSGSHARWRTSVSLRT